MVAQQLQMDHKIELRESGIKWKLKLPWPVAKAVCWGISQLPVWWEIVSSAMDSVLQWEGKTQYKKGRDHVRLLIYCTPCSAVPSTSAMGLGEMSSGRQQAAELDQPPVLY